MYCLHSYLNRTAIHHTAIHHLNMAIAEVDSSKPDTLLDSFTKLFTSDYLNRFLDILNQVAAINPAETGLVWEGSNSAFRGAYALCNGNPDRNQNIQVRWKFNVFMLHFPQTNLANNSASVPLKVSCTAYKPLAFPALHEHEQSIPFPITLSILLLMLFDLRGHL